MQRKWKKAVAALTVAALGMTTFAGCDGSTASDGSQAADTSAADGQVTIKFVHKFPEDKRMQYFNDIVAEFEEKNPNIKVEMTSYGDEEIKDKTRVLLGSADAPDIFFTWSGERITQYVDSGNAMDISKYLEDDSAWKDSFNQTMLETCNKNGSYWAIPWDYSSKEIVYNKQVFANAGVTETPKTWDEFLDVCEKIKASGVTPIALGNQYSWVVCHYITTLNGKLVPQDTIQSNYSLENTDFTDAGYAKALDMMKELLDKGYVNTDVNSCTWEMSESMVQEGTAGMVYEEVQNLKAYDDKLGDDWGYFDFPEIEGEAGASGYITGGPDVFMVNAASKHPDEAITFLKWLTSDEVQAKMVYELGFLPCTNVQLDADKCMSETLEIINKNMDAPGISEWLDCALNQTVADTYLIGCQTIFEDENGESIMKEVSETAKEVAADQ
ncbi:MAG: ABC transporter substrate-binding protein [Blautia sp.]